MERAKRARETNRILFPPSSYITMPAEVIYNVLPELSGKRAGQLYLAMYDMARLSPTRRFRASLTDLRAQMRCDPRVVRRCLNELREKGFVKRVHSGTARSRSDKPRWRVPLSEFGLAAGNWIPLPRFFITHYLPAFPGSLLLIILLFHQHLKWKNHCWPGVARLAKLTGWKSRTVYRQLHEMGHRGPWERLGTALPRPLKILLHRNKNGKEIRHFRVRAVHYHSIPGRKQPVVGLAKQFAEHFGLVKNTGAPDREADDEVA